jgi:hypothetical protein
MVKAKAGVLDRMHSARITGRPVFFDGGFCGAGFPFVFSVLAGEYGSHTVVAQSPIWESTAIWAWY